MLSDKSDSDYFDFYEEQAQIDFYEEQMQSALSELADGVSALRDFSFDAETNHPEISRAQGRLENAMRMLENALPSPYWRNDGQAT